MTSLSEANSSENSGESRWREAEAVAIFISSKQNELLKDGSQEKKKKSFYNQPKRRENVRSVLAKLIPEFVPTPSRGQQGLWYGLDQRLCSEAVTLEV